MKGREEMKRMSNKNRRTMDGKACVVMTRKIAMVSLAIAMMFGAAGDVDVLKYFGGNIGFIMEVRASEPTIGMNRMEMTRAEFLAWASDRAAGTRNNRNGGFTGLEFASSDKLYTPEEFFDKYRGSSFQMSGTTRVRHDTSFALNGVRGGQGANSGDHGTGSSGANTSSGQRSNQNSGQGSNLQESGVSSVPNDFWSTLPADVIEAVRNESTFEQMKQLFPNLADETIQTIFEQEVIRLVNEIRAERGLVPLIYHPELANIARLRALETDLLPDRHVSRTTGLAHTEHAIAMGLDVSFAGENRGGGQRTPQQVVNSWMNSQAGHREFILSGSNGNRFGNDLIYIGVGFSGNLSTRKWVLWQSTKIGS